MEELEDETKPGGERANEQGMDLASDEKDQSQEEVEGKKVRKRVPPKRPKGGRLGFTWKGRNRKTPVYDGEDSNSGRGCRHCGGCSRRSRQQRGHNHPGTEDIEGVKGRHQGAGQNDQAAE